MARNVGSTLILIFSKSGKTDKVWFYRMENDGFNDDANKTPVDGSELPKIVDLWKQKDKASYKPEDKKHRFVSYEEIVENDYDLATSVYLSGYTYPDKFPIHHLDEYFKIEKGNVGAAAAKDGEYTFITTAQETKTHSSYSFKGEAICIPTVSSTGHGHASIKHIHYVNGEFEAATIVAVLMQREGAIIYVPYVYYYLLTHKEELLVYLMRGSTNVSLSIPRLEKLKIPVPPYEEQIQRFHAQLITLKFGSMLKITVYIVLGYRCKGFLDNINKHRQQSHLLSLDILFYFGK